jgi:hypothetical protein
VTEESRETVQVAMVTHDGPPPNELPALIDPGRVAWRSEAVALSVPYLLVYTTGAEFVLLGRSKARRVDATKLAQELRRGFGGHETGQGFSFRSLGVVALGSEVRDDGAFRCLGWVPIPAAGDVVMSLEWPSQGIAKGEHRIEGERIRQAAGRALNLWA